MEQQLSQLTGISLLAKRTDQTRKGICSQNFSTAKYVDRTRSDGYDRHK